MRNTTMRHEIGDTLGVFKCVYLPVKQFINGITEDQ